MNLSASNNTKEFSNEEVIELLEMIDRKHQDIQNAYTVLYV